jgi:hypothetical protein
MSLLLKFGGITQFIVILLTNYKNWGSDESTDSIPQTKQKREEWENDRLAYYSNQTP